CPAGDRVKRTARVPHEERQQQAREESARQQAAQPQPPLAAVLGDRDGDGGHRECQAGAGEHTDEQDLPDRHGCLQTGESDVSGGETAAYYDILKDSKFFIQSILAHASRIDPMSPAFARIPSVTLAKGPGG